MRLQYAAQALLNPCLINSQIAANCLPPQLHTPKNISSLQSFSGLSHYLAAELGHLPKYMADPSPEMLAWAKQLQERMKKPIVEAVVTASSNKVIPSATKDLLVNAAGREDGLYILAAHLFDKVSQSATGDAARLTALANAAITLQAIYDHTIGLALSQAHER